MARLLLVDDSATVRTVARRALAPLFEEIVEASEGFEAWKYLAEHVPDVVVSDLHMPKCDGVKLLHLRKQKRALENVPFILLTSVDDHDRKADLLELGAADYVVKPFHERELVARVRVHLRLRLLQEELREANEKLHELSTTDGLTGLRNRRHFDEALEREIARAHRYGTPLSLILADIDHFKAVNDTLGHAGGDEVLRAFARVMRAGLRTNDIAARYGGEEVALIMPHTDLPGATTVAERLRATFASEVVVVGEREHRSTASFGVATMNADSSKLVERADRALYRSKAEGRDRVSSEPD